MMLRGDTTIDNGKREKRKETGDFESHVLQDDRLLLLEHGLRLRLQDGQAFPYPPDLQLIRLRFETRLRDCGISGKFHLTCLEFAGYPGEVDILPYDLLSGFIREVAGISQAGLLDLDAESTQGPAGKIELRRASQSPDSIQWIPVVERAPSEHESRDQEPGAPPCRVEDTLADWGESHSPMIPAGGETALARRNGRSLINLALRGVYSTTGASGPSPFCARGGMTAVAPRPRATGTNPTSCMRGERLHSAPQGGIHPRKRHRSPLCYNPRTSEGGRALVSHQQ